MLHTPGKLASFRQSSGHKMTRAKIVAAALALQARGEIFASIKMWNRLETQQAKPMLNQRQRRKYNRSRHAAGFKNAFN